MLFLLTSLCLSAQKVVVKTNLLYDATATINLGVEKGLSSKWTIDLSANFTTRSGNTGWCSRNCAIGRANVSTAILWGRICSVEFIT